MSGHRWYQGDPVAAVMERLWLRTLTLLLDRYSLGRTHTHTHTHTLIETHTHTLIETHTHTHIQTHTHTHTHTDTHTKTLDSDIERCNNG